MKNKNDFKIKLGKSIRELSICFDSQLEPINQNILKNMTNKIVELIESSNLSKNIEFYQSAIDKIMRGEIEIYKLNVISLMKVFQSQVGEISAKVRTTRNDWR